MERDRRSEELHKKKRLIHLNYNHDEEREKKPKGTTPGGTRYFRNFWVGYAPGTLEPLTYNRASSAKFCYPRLEYKPPQIPPILE